MFDWCLGSIKRMYKGFKQDQRLGNSLQDGTRKWHYSEETTRSPSFSNIRISLTRSKIWNVCVCIFIFSGECLEGVYKVPRGYIESG